VLLFQHIVYIFHALEVLFYSNFSSSFYFCQLWILFRKSAFSHKPHAFYNYCITADYFRVIQALYLNSLYWILYSLDYSTQTQCTEQINMIQECKLRVIYSSLNVPSVSSTNASTLMKYCDYRWFILFNAPITRAVTRPRMAFSMLANVWWNSIISCHNPKDAVVWYWGR